MTDFPEQAAAIIAQKMPGFKPKLAIVLGSGLGPLAELISDSVCIPYADLPGFPELNVHGHTSQLTLGYLEGLPIACLQGRAHTYENPDYEPIKTYVRTMKLIGCEYYIATNAAGSLRSDVGPGSLVLINDHINFQPGNPLVGPNADKFGPRFPPLDKAYDADLRALIKQQAEALQINLPEGIYISVLGPSYETVAEINAFKILGADVIGMSTVPEVIVANHCGLKVAVISTITNLATGLTTTSHDHNEVVIQAERASKQLCLLMKKIAGQLNTVLN